MSRRQTVTAGVGRRVRAIVPSVAGWNTDRGALANLLVFALVALGGEWIVHQIEYLIVYGSRFDAVMAATPHHLYMRPAGIVLAGVGLTLLLTAALVVAAAGLEKRRLLAALPARFRGHISGRTWHLPTSGLVQTAGALAGFQIVLYLIQENLESEAVGAGWPVLSVIFAPEHASVIPLHVLTAGCSSIVLWAVSAWLHRSRQTLQVARILVSLACARPVPVVRPVPSDLRLPARNIIAGVLGLRSPPLTV